MSSPEVSPQSSSQMDDVISWVVDLPESDDALVRVVPGPTDHRNVLRELQTEYPSAPIMGLFGIDILKVEE